MGMICSVEGCSRVTTARGWCKMHYYRWKRNGDPLGFGVRNPVTEPTVRFGRKIEKDPVSGCWNWTASRHRDGYGWFGPGGRGRAVLAHRWAYENFVGPIPSGLYILHHCDNPPCVNPDHLFVGTQADNVADCIRKGRHAKMPRKFDEWEAQRA